MRLERPTTTPWADPALYWRSLTEATAELDTPLGAICSGALAQNAFEMLDRAAGTPIRVASKSVRVRGVLEAVLALDGYAGVLAYTLPEALWLAADAPGWVGIRDVVVGYPTVDRAALVTLGRSAELASRVTIMVDSVAQLDFVDSVIAPKDRESIRVCIELDASWNAPALGHIGVWRSPIHEPADARSLAESIVARAGFTLVGMMGYEAQIAGLGNEPIGHRLRGVGLRWLQKRSLAELIDRRGAAVASVREVAELEFVNGGGTGSIEATRSDPSVTEIAAGSGLFGPHLFDNYGHFTPVPAAAFALSVVRKPTPEMATLLGGGWIASGPTGVDRQPSPVWPTGLSFVAREAAGEVQTPLTGASALGVGDRVWLRHTKAGELSEHLDEFAVVQADALVDRLPTYRGEGKAFL